MNGVPADEATANDFIMVRAALVRRVGGANEALVWSRLYFRASERGNPFRDDQDVCWWRASADQVADETGLSPDQVKRALTSLEAGHFVESTEHRLNGNYDRTKSYRPLVWDRTVDRANSHDGASDSALRTVRIRAQDRANSHDVPSSQNVREQEQELFPRDEVSGAATASEMPALRASAVAEVQRADVEQMCSLLADLIEQNGSRRPAVTTGWRTAARLLLDRDGVALGDALAVMSWCQADGFWRGNILSMPTFRAKYNQLRLKMQAGGSNSRRRRVDENLALVEQYREEEAREQDGSRTAIDPR